jgi:outer membrane protein OmpA-like peptidoglycan-associated protein
MRWLIGLPLLASLVACAAPAPAPSPEPAGQRFPVFFTPASGSLGQGADGVVNAAAEFANRYKDKPVTLEAYAAPPGHHYVEPANIDTTRAAAVTAQLVADGVNPSRINVVPKGPVQPAVPFSKIEVRRVDIIVGAPPAAN